MVEIATHYIEFVRENINERDVENGSSTVRFNYSKINNTKVTNLHTNKEIDKYVISY